MRPRFIASLFAVAGLVVLLGFALRNNGSVKPLGAGEAAHDGTQTGASLPEVEKPSRPELMSGAALPAPAPGTSVGNGAPQAVTVVAQEFIERATAAAPAKPEDSRVTDPPPKVAPALESDDQKIQHVLSAILGVVVKPQEITQDKGSGKLLIQEVLEGGAAEKMGIPRSVWMRIEGSSRVRETGLPPSGPGCPFIRT